VEAVAVALIRSAEFVDELTDQVARRAADPLSGWVDQRTAMHPRLYRAAVAAGVARRDPRCMISGQRHLMRRDAYVEWLRTASLQPPSEAAPLDDTLLRDLGLEAAR